MLCPGEELGSNGAACAKGEYIELASIFGCTLSAEANIYILGSDAGGNCEGKLSNSAIILTEESRPGGFTTGNTKIEVLEDYKGDFVQSKMEVFIGMNVTLEMEDMLWIGRGED